MSEKVNEEVSKMRGLGCTDDLVFAGATADEEFLSEALHTSLRRARRAIKDII